MFMKEVEICGHILREGRRSPAPVKLLSIQKWELPATITELRGFLGLTNYYSCYVPNYSTYAAPLMSRLQVGRVEGKKGSVKPVEWDYDSRQAFENIKKALANGLEVYRIEPDEPFILRTDASDFALGAVLDNSENGDGSQWRFTVENWPKARKTGTPPGKGNLCHRGRASQMGGMDRLPASGSKDRSLIARALGLGKCRYTFGSHWSSSSLA